MSAHHWDNKVKLTLHGSQHTAVLMDDGTVDKLYTYDCLDVWPRCSEATKARVQKRVDKLLEL
jgi:hypothetical protein